MQPNSVFPASALLRVVSWLVPGRRRDEWIAEWSGEIAHAWREAERAGHSGPLLRLRLALRSLESVPDAISLRRRQGGSGGWLSTAREVTRSLRRHPGFALSVILTLALGIGSATAIYTILDGLMLRPIPFRNPEQLVSVASMNGGGPALPNNAELLDFWRSRKDVFQDARAHSRQFMILTGPIEARGYVVERVEPGFLEMLGVTPIIGRSFGRTDATSDKERVLLLGYDAWRDDFGGDRSVLGHVVQLEGQPYTIVGVLPPTMRLLPLGPLSLMIPLSDEAPPRTISLLGRLREGLSLDAARTRLASATWQLDAERGRKRGWAVTLMPFDRYIDAESRQRFWTLGGAVLCLLLISCVNAAGLLFLRGVGRRPELALRLALGSSRGALVRQAFMESTVLSLVAGGLGAAVAWAGVPLLVSFMPQGLLFDSYTPVAVDNRVLLFAFVLTGATGLLFGTVPALRTASTAAAHAGRSATASRGDLRVRTAVQAAQLALAVVLLSGTALFAKSFAALLSVPLGYDVDRVLSLSLLPLERSRGGADAEAAFMSELDRRLAALPGVEGVARSGGRATHYNYTLGFEDGSLHPAAQGERLPSTTVDTAYFRVMGIPIVEGRGFVATDAEREEGAVVVNREFASRYWVGSPVGRRFRIDEDWYTVVGLIEEIKLEGPLDPGGESLVIYPGTARELRGAPVTIRASGDPARLIPDVRDVVRELDPSQPIAGIQTGRALLGQRVADPRFLLVIMSVFAGVAVALCAIGVYGLVSFTVAQRTREIGVRMALGARVRKVVAEVLRWGLAPVGVGLVLGLGASALLSRFVRTLLFGVSPLDPQAMGAAAAVLVIACALALTIPALRAARIAPVEALRVE